MGKHAETLRALIDGDLGEWVKELMEDPTISVALRVKVMVPFSNALNQLKTTAEHLDREEPAKEGE